MSPDAKLTRRVCAINDALEIVGDRYALAMVREIGYGNTRFKELAAFTGAPRDVLTARLRRLEESGVIERRAYSARPRRHDYELTDAGRRLLPILLALKEWGDEHCRPGPPTVVLEHSCGAEFHPLTVCAACREVVDREDLTVVGGTHPPTITA